MLRGVQKVMPHGGEGHDPCQEEHGEGGEQTLPLEAALAVRHLVGLNEPRVVTIRSARYETEAPGQKKTHTHTQRQKKKKRDRNQGQKTEGKVQKTQTNNTYTRTPKQTDTTDVKHHEVDDWFVGSSNNKYRQRGKRGLQNP